MGSFSFSLLTYSDYPLGMQRESCHGLSRVEQKKGCILERSEYLADLRTKLRTTYDQSPHSRLQVRRDLVEDANLGKQLHRRAVFKFNLNLSCYVLLRPLRDVICECSQSSYTRIYH